MIHVDILLFFGFAKVATCRRNGCPWFQRHEWSTRVVAFQCNGLARLSFSGKRQKQLEQRAELQRAMKRPGCRPKSVSCCCLSVAVRFCFVRLRIIISRVSLCRQCKHLVGRLGAQVLKELLPPRLSTRKCALPPPPLLALRPLASHPAGGRVRSPAEGAQSPEALSGLRTC